MRPIKLHLSGFTSFKKKIEVDFSRLQVFSITGMNGAGKSSLLEAIIFALYGFTPKMGKEKKELVSQGENELNVLLQFSIGSDVYQVSRRFKIVGTPYATIEKQSNGNWITVAEGDSLVTEHVEQLLRMPYNAFIQAVIVPQDQFAAFLKPGKPKERRNMLMQMFDLEVYEKMRERAQELNLQARQMADTLDTQLKGRYREATAENLAERKKIKKKLQSELKSAKGSQKDLKALYQIAQDVVQMKERIREQSQKTKISADLLEKEREKKRELEQAVKRWNEEQVAQTPLLIKQITQLAALYEKFEVVGKKQSEAEELQQKFQKAKNEISALEKSVEGKYADLKSLENKLKEARKHLEKLDYDDALFEALNSLSRVLVQISSAEEGMQKNRQDLKLEQEKLRSLEKEVLQLQEKLEKEDTLLNSVQQQYQTAQRAWHVYELRMGIEPGSDCPVCGTVMKHPPAISPEECESAERNLQLLQIQQNEMQKQGETIRQQLNFRMAEIKSAERNVKKLSKGLRDAQEEIEKLKQRVTQTIDIPSGNDPFVFAIGRQKYLQDARKNYQSLRNEIDQSEKVSGEKEKLRQKDAHDIELKRRDAQFLHVRLQESQNALSALLKELRLSDESDLRETKESILQQRDDLEKRLDEIRQKESRLKEENDRAAGLLTGLEQSHAKELETLQLWESEMNRFSEEEKKLEKSDAEDIHFQLEKTQSELEDLNKRLGEAVTRIHEIEEEIREAEKLEREMKQAQKERDLFGQLATMLRNDRLQNYVFGKLLRSLVDNCNVILRDLTLGKYALDLDKNEDLVICDFWNGGASRSVRTLSGGETFVVSLALALALSSAVKGGIHIESLFLDEGFGSLDRQRLDLVRDALLKLQLYDKMVGVVTHLEDFANAFPAQLSVVGGTEGSEIILASS